MIHLKDSLRSIPTSMRKRSTNALKLSTSEWRPNALRTVLSEPLNDAGVDDDDIRTEEFGGY